MILITGATGLVGSHLMAHLLIKNDVVRCLKRTTSSLKQVDYVLKFYNIPKDKYEKNVTWANADLNDESALKEAMNGVSILYHCAADVGLGGVDEEKMRNINVEGTKLIVKVAKQSEVQTLCYMSSIAALGKEANPQIHISENSPWTEHANLSPYAKSKHDAEEFVLSSQDDKFKVIVVNPGPILGVSCNNASSSKIIYLAKNGIPFSTNGGTGYVDVRDVCIAMITLVEKGIYKERFLLVGFNASNHELLKGFLHEFGKSTPMQVPRWAVMTIATILEYGAKCFGKKVQLNRGFARTSLSRTWYDNSKIKNAIDFEFIPIKKTISDIAGFMK